VSWFLSTKGNEYFCEVDEEYILDRFNLTGLNAEVSNYALALDLITDIMGLFPLFLLFCTRVCPSNSLFLEEELPDDPRDAVEASARHLYGLIHARYILTARGLNKMVEKYKKADFGRCPRVLCYSTALVPVGLADVPNQKAVKLYCPRCEDIYSPKSSRHGAIDGAYFGSTLPHMMFMVYPNILPTKNVPGTSSASSAMGGSSVGSSSSAAAQAQQVPSPGAPNAAAKAERTRVRVFGFQIHETARLMRWQEAWRDRYVFLYVRRLALVYDFLRCFLPLSPFSLSQIERLETLDRKGLLE
jgi:casein kinase II subunit beta